MWFFLTVASFGILLAAIAAVLLARAVASRRRRSRDGLFRFHDGAREREVDPIAVLMALEAHPKFRLDLDPRRALEDGDRDAMALMADAVRQAFGVPEFTQPGRSGLTVFECVELLAVFIAYIDLQKKSTSRPPTSPPHTESTSTASGEKTTLNTSDSGSTGVEPSPSTV